MKIFKMFGQIDNAPEKFLEHYYEDKYENLVGFTGGVVFGFIILVLSSIFIHYKLSNYPERTAFLVFQDSKKMKIQVYGRPLLNDFSLKEWFSKAVKDMYSMDQLNYQKQIEKSSKYFTPEAYALFVERINETMVKNMIEKQAIITTMVNEPPTILQTSYVGEKKVWRMTAPITILYEGSFSDGSVRVVKANVDATLISIDTTENFRGLGITKLSIY